MTDIDSEATCEEIIAFLQGLRSEANIAGMARFGIETSTALGISNPDLQQIARKVRRDQELAQALWETGIREARMLAIYTAEPKKITLDQARHWADEFASWEVVDTAADLFVTARLEGVLIPEFAWDPREFVRRTAFAMIAGAAVHLKKEPDSAILAYLPLIGAYATDERNFVRKAVNWALRNIGKRSLACHGPALALAERLASSADKSARWIGKDAVRELRSEKVLARLNKKSGGMP